MQEKKVFNEVWILFLVLIALANDAIEIFFDLLAATVVGFVGEALMEPLNLFFDLFFDGVFFMKCGFGGPSMLQVLDNILEAIGIPGRTICVIAGIYMANNPDSEIAKKIKVAAAVEGGGATGELSEVDEVAQETENLAARSAGEAEGAAREAESASKTTKEGAGPKEEEGAEKSAGQEEEDGEKEEAKKKETDELESPEERDPEDVEREKLFEEQSDEGFGGSDVEEEPEAETPESKRDIEPATKTFKKVQDINDRRNRNKDNATQDEGLGKAA